MHAYVHSLDDAVFDLVCSDFHHLLFICVLFPSSVMIVSIGKYCRNHIFRRFWLITRACLVSCLDIPQEEPWFSRYDLPLNDNVLTISVHSSVSKLVSLLFRRCSTLVLDLAYQEWFLHHQQLEFNHLTPSMQ